MRHFRTLLALFVLLLAAGSAFAAPASKTPFDHLTTGFELDGKHRETACESCHVNACLLYTSPSPRD